MTTSVTSGYLNSVYASSGVSNSTTMLNSYRASIASASQLSPAEGDGHQAGHNLEDDEYCGKGLTGAHSPTDVVGSLGEGNNTGGPESPDEGKQFGAISAYSDGTTSTGQFQQNATSSLSGKKCSLLSLSLKHFYAKKEENIRKQTYQ